MTFLFVTLKFIAKINVVMDHFERNGLYEKKREEEEEENETKGKLWPILKIPEDYWSNKPVDRVKLAAFVGRCCVVGMLQHLSVHSMVMRFNCVNIQ